MHRAIICIMLLSPAMASAVTAKDLVLCSALEDSVKRLECYDNLAANEHGEASNKAAQNLGGGGQTQRWHVSIETSKLDDSTTVALTNDSITEAPGRFGRPSRPTLILRCQQNTTAAYIHFDGHFMSEHRGHGRVTVRVDKNKARTISMDASTNNKALGLWSGSTAIPFIKSMLDGQALVLQAIPFSESPLTIEFDISGIGEAIIPLRKACNW